MKKTKPVKKYKQAPKRTSKVTNKQTTWRVLAIIVLLLGLVITVIALQYQQHLNQEAALKTTYVPGQTLDKNGFVDYPPDNVPDTTAIAAVNGTKTTVTYCNGMQMDIYKPTTTSACMPVGVYVHGGGWRSGSRSGLAPSDVTPNTMNNLLAQGFLVASIDYKLGAPPSSYPQNINDVSCAVRYLRSNASQLQIDPDHIGLWGDSAGGHLVALAGIANQTGGFDTGDFPGVSSKVQAVADLFGPTQMTTGIFGTAQANPITWISKTDTIPPFLILQGTDDSIVPLSESQALHDALKAGNHESTLQIVQNTGHEFVPEGTPPNSELTKMMTDFFIAKLKVTTGGACGTPQPSIAPTIAPNPQPTFVCLGNTCPTGSPTPTPSRAVVPSTVVTQPITTVAPLPTGQVEQPPAEPEFPTPNNPNNGGSFFQILLNFIKQLLELLLSLFR